jgi:hypothetical protein
MQQIIFDFFPSLNLPGETVCSTERPNQPGTAGSFPAGLKQSVHAAAYLASTRADVEKSGATTLFPLYIFEACIGKIFKVKKRRTDPSETSTLIYQTARCYTSEDGRCICQK